MYKKGKGYNCILQTKEKGLKTIITSFAKKNSIFEKSGLKKDDEIEEIKLFDCRGKNIEGFSRSLLSYQLLVIDTIEASMTLRFTIVRGKGKNAQTLTIDVPVEWDEDELKMIDKEWEKNRK